MSVNTESENGGRVDRRWKRTCFKKKKKLPQTHSRLSWLNASNASLLYLCTNLCDFCLISWTRTLCLPGAKSRWRHCQLSITFR